MLRNSPAIINLCAESLLRGFNIPGSCCSLLAVSTSSCCNLSETRLGTRLLSSAASCSPSRQGEHNALLLSAAGSQGSKNDGGSSRQSHHWLPWTAKVTAGAAAAALTACGVSHAHAVSTTGKAYAANQPEVSPPEPHEDFSLLGLHWRQRLFFKYEKRMRTSPSLQKIFNYFASQERDGDKYMLPHDLMHALVPTYPPHGTRQERAGFLDGERTPQALQRASAAEKRVFAFFDVDNDGLLSYMEFLLVVTLLSIPEVDVKTIFDVIDLDRNGTVSLEEFEAALQLIWSSPAAQGNAKGQPSLAKGVAGLLVSLFGPDDATGVSLGSFQAFVGSLNETLVELEFEHYDVKGQGYILGTDFAHSLVTNANMHNIDRLLDHADAVPPALASAHISLQDFKAVHRLHRHAHALKIACNLLANLGKPITQATFSSLLDRLADVKLSQEVLDIIFHVCESGPGNLDVKTFFKLLVRRSVAETRQVDFAGDNDSLTESIKGFFSCVGSCISR